mmetsp:Transcript_10816/g.36704  ORF Transcript_10816/g.36704 Transcript_10816/m.36704 type:complete len:202 (+) Transcript_10816:215-820(+)
MPAVAISTLGYRGQELGQPSEGAHHPLERLGMRPLLRHRARGAGLWRELSGRVTPPVGGLAVALCRRRDPALPEPPRALPGRARGWKLASSPLLRAQRVDQSPVRRDPRGGPPAGVGRGCLCCAVRGHAPRGAPRAGRQAHEAGQRHGGRHRRVHDHAHARRELPVRPVPLQHHAPIPGGHRGGGLRLLALRRVRPWGHLL